MTKVKICGITNLEDALLSVNLGADVLGFNFYQGSKRYISPEESARLVEELDSTVRKVGVFVNATIDDILFARTLAGLDGVQLHGDESEAFVSEVRNNMNTEIIKAIRVRSNSDLRDVRQTKADAILLDGFSPDEFGGTGKVFDWEIATQASCKIESLYLAGGLDPDNVRSAILAVRPYAVDVASGVESSPGKKDAKKLEAFIRNAKRA